MQFGLRSLPVAFPPHALIQFGGTLDTLSGPAEIWACGIRVEIGAPDGHFLKDPGAYATAIGPKIATWFSTPSSGMHNGAQCTFVKVNNIKPDGTYQDATTHQAALSARGGVSPTAPAPAFCSLAYTWETGLTRGHAHRGRIYPPNYAYAPSGSQVPGSSVTAAVTAAKALLNVINSTLDGGTLVKPMVVSSIGAGTMNGITGVSVDNIYDVQRRRKNRLLSTRTTQSWP